MTGNKPPKTGGTLEKKTRDCWTYLQESFSLSGLNTLELHHQNIGLKKLTNIQNMYK